MSEAGTAKMKYMICAFNSGIMPGTDWHRIATANKHCRATIYWHLDLNSNILKKRHSENTTATPFARPRVCEEKRSAQRENEKTINLRL